MTNRTAELASLAAQMGLSLSAAVALPTAVTVAARKVGMDEARFIREMNRNGELRAYVASACHKAAA